MDLISEAKAEVVVTEEDIDDSTKIKVQNTFLNSFKLYWQKNERACTNSE